MAGRIQWWWLPAGLLLTVGFAGCNPGRAYNDWVARKPEPARFACSSSGALTNTSTLPVPVLMGSVQAGPSPAIYAGDLNQHPDSIYVPFSDETPPLRVLEADLKRILAAHQPSAPAGITLVPLQLHATLHVAYTHRTFHFIKSSEMVGRVVFDFAIIDLRGGRTNWTQRIAQEHRVRPGYVTSRSVEEALNGAYCQALAEFKKALGSAELQETLRQER